jgi:hypothetical protein
MLFRLVVQFWFIMHRLHITLLQLTLFSHHLGGRGALAGGGGIIPGKGCGIGKEIKTISTVSNDVDNLDCVFIKDRKSFANKLAKLLPRELFLVFSV